MTKVPVILMVFVVIFVSCRNNNSRTESANEQIIDSSSVITDSSLSRDMRQPEMKMKEDVSAMTFTGDPDYDFAALMKRHHEAAIQMCNMEIDYGKNEMVKQMAEKIIDDSRTDNLTLDAFIKRHQPDSIGGKDFAKQMQDNMRQPGPENGDMAIVDDSFINLMKRHHEKGIAMANLYLQYAKEPEPKAIAKSVIRTNTADLNEMQNSRR